MDLPVMNVRLTDAPAGAALPAVNVRVLGGAGGGGGGLPFDFKAYRAAVTLGDDPVITANWTVDEDVTWCSQWGKVIDLTFRFDGTQAGGDVDFPAHTTWAVITGIGITMSGYRQQIPMMAGLTAGDAGTDSASGSLYPFQISMVNPGDFRAGYRLENMIIFSLDTAKHYYCKGNVQLIGRTYWKDGELTHDPGDFT